MSRRLALVLTAAVALAVVSCKGNQPPATAPQKTSASAPPARAQTVKPADAPPAAPTVFTYNATGLRDPFEPFIRIEEKKPGPANAPKAFVARTPLQRYTVEELKLVGVLWTPGGAARALVEDPQNKGYMVNVGTFVGDRGGKIVRIQPDRVVIEVRFTDVLGEEKVTMSNMVLHKSEGEVRP